MLKNSNILKDCVLYVKNQNVVFIVKAIVKELFINNVVRSSNKKDKQILIKCHQK